MSAKTLNADASLFVDSIDRYNNYYNSMEFKHDASGNPESYQRVGERSLSMK